jgi:hypothetical protein
MLFFVVLKNNENLFNHLLIKEKTFIIKKNKYLISLDDENLISTTSEFIPKEHNILLIE